MMMIRSKSNSMRVFNMYLTMAFVVIGNSSGFMLFSNPQQQQRQPQDHPSPSSATQHFSSSSSSSSSWSFPANEFSRMFKTEKIVSRSPTRNRRDFSMSISATLEECDKLSKRFDIKGLTTLQADLILRQANPGGGGGMSSSSLSSPVVQVQGTITGHLTQTCVRSNQDFEVDVEFPIHAIVKPVSDSFLYDHMASSSSSYDDKNDADNTDRPKKKKNKKNPRRQNYNEIDLMELESQLTFNILTDDDDLNNENTIIEDEAIYALGSDALDIGELVAQTFWLSLDPYPKKPGTDPIEYELSTLKDN